MTSIPSGPPMLPSASGSGADQRLAPALARTASAAKVKLAVTDIADDAVARTELNSGRLDVALTLGASSARVEVKQTLSATIMALLGATVDEAHLRGALAHAGVPPSTVVTALAPVPIITTALQPSPPDDAARGVAAVAAGLLMYLSLSIYCAAVATGVAQEKTSRTAEVLLAAVRPAQLLAGKVIGIGLTGLGQLTGARRCDEASQSPNKPRSLAGHPDANGRDRGLTALNHSLESLVLARYARRTTAGSISEESRPAMVGSATSRPAGFA